MGTRTPAVRVGPITVKQDRVGSYRFCVTSSLVSSWRPAAGAEGPSPLQTGPIRFQKLQIFLEYAALITSLPPHRDPSTVPPPAGRTRGSDPGSRAAGHPEPPALGVLDGQKNQSRGQQLVLPARHQNLDQFQPKTGSDPGSGLEIKNWAFSGSTD